MKKITKLLSLAIMLFACSIAFAGGIALHPKANSYATFDGSTTLMDLGYDTASSLALTNYTVELWILPQYNSTVGNNNYILSNGACNIACPSVTLGIGPVGDCAKNWGASNQLNFFMTTDKDTVALSSHTNVTYNAWTHVAVSYDGKMARFYVNAVEVDSTATKGMPVMTTANMYAGAAPGWWCGINEQSAYKGSMSELRMWNVARTQSQIAMYADSAINPASAGLVEYYPFTDATGTTESHSTTSVKDSLTDYNIVFGNFGGLTLHPAECSFANFDGSTTLLDLGHDTASNLGLANFTVELWVNAQNNYSGSNYILTNGACNISCPSNTLGIGQIGNCAKSWNNTDQLGFFMTTNLDTAWVGMPGSISYNTWTHVAATYDGAMVRFYVNTVEVDSAAISGMPQMTAADMFAGAAPGWWCSINQLSSYSGSMSELRIWNVARTQSQIAMYADSAINPASIGLVEYYPLNNITSGVFHSSAILADSATNYNVLSSGITNSGVTLNVSGAQHIINGGTTQLYATPGSAQLLWSNGMVGDTITVSPTTNTQYTVNFTVCGITVADSVTVNTVSDNSVLANTELCSYNTSDSVNIATSIGNNYSYSLFNSNDSLLAGPKTATTSPITLAGNTTNGQYNVMLSDSGTALTEQYYNATYVSLNSTAANQIPTNGAYTIEAWIKPTSTGYGSAGIIGWGTWGNTNLVNAFKLYDDGGVPALSNYWWSNDLGIDVPTITNGQWHYVAVSFDGTTRTLYMDGDSLTSDMPVGHNVTNTGNLQVGVTNNGEYFDGSLDEVKVWNVAHYLPQVVQDMKAICNVQANPSLVLYYSFNDAGNNLVPDETGYSNNGILQNATGSDWGTGAVACTQTTSLNATVNTPPVVNVSTITTCPDMYDTLTAKVTGNGPFTYSWNNSGTSDTIMVKNSGKYIVTATDKYGCVTMDTAKASFFSKTNIMVMGKDSIIDGLTDTLVASGAATTFTWTGGGSVSTSTDTNYVMPSSQTTYTITGKDVHGCADTAWFTVKVELFTSVNNITDGSKLSAYPVPAIDVVYLAFQTNGTESANIEVMDVMGKVIMNTTSTISNGAALPINISTLAQGTYFVRVTANNHTQTVKFIKQ